MTTSKPIDSLSQNRSHRPAAAENKGTSSELTANQPPPMRSASAKGSTQHPETKFGFCKILVISWLNSWRVETFHLSLIRTIFSLRPFLFSVLPVVYFQLSSGLALRSDQALQMIRNFIGSEQTSNYITVGGMALALLSISWLADMIFAPSLEKLTYTRLDHRKPSVSNSMLDSTSEINQTFIMRLVHGLASMTVVFFSILIIFIGQELADDIKNRLIYGLVSLLIIIVILAVHESARWFSQGYLAVSSSLGGAFRLIFDNFFSKFLRKIGYGLVWLTGLLVYLVLSLVVVWLEIAFLTKTSGYVWAILILAASTMVIYLLWTNWIGFSNNYWTSLLHERTSSNQIARVIQNSEKPEKFRIWPILLVITILVFVVLVYFFIIITNVDLIIQTFTKISALLPKNFQLLIPKPN